MPLISATIRGLPASDSHRSFDLQQMMEESLLDRFAWQTDATPRRARVAA
jgi:hypothetical protein